MTLPPNPFRGLVPYGENDRLHGRDADLTLMKDRIFRARTTLLFAGSGVGKTSFFKAKLIPEIQRRYKTQFRIVYHNRWTSQEPLAALKETLDADRAQPLRAAFQTKASTPGNAIVVLDQFEELFQHHLYWPYFDTFRDELCDLINDATIPLQVVFSMREEFLGQLSAFDNRIPDIFGNYYRLKNPDTRQAEEIIEATVNGAGVQVHSKGLEDLVEDLTRIEVRGATRKSKKNPVSIRRDFVVPPHLQLVCQKLWDAEVSHFKNGGSDFEFLADYADRRGGGEDRARTMLEQFCVDAMNDLSLDQRNVAARAFDFLVTSQGAKMAYELKSLARHMVEPEPLLGSTLDKLSAVKNPPPAGAAGRAVVRAIPRHVRTDRLGLEGTVRGRSPPRVTRDGVRPQGGGFRGLRESGRRAPLLAEGTGDPGYAGPPPAGRASGG